MSMSGTGCVCCKWAPAVLNQGNYYALHFTQQELERALSKMALKFNAHHYGQVQQAYCILGKTQVGECVLCDISTDTLIWQAIFCELHVLIFITPILSFHNLFNCLILTVRVSICRWSAI